jgi:hypothetical protein
MRVCLSLWCFGLVRRLGRKLLSGHYQSAACSAACSDSNARQSRRAFICTRKPITGQLFVMPSLSPSERVVRQRFSFVRRPTSRVFWASRLHSRFRFSLSTSPILPAGRLQSLPYRQLRSSGVLPYRSCTLLRTPRAQQKYPQSACSTDHVPSSTSGQHHLGSSLSNPLDEHCIKDEHHTQSNPPDRGVTDAKMGALGVLNDMPSPS